MRRNPVIVFAGSFWAGSTERGLAEGLRALGWAVQEIDRQDFGIAAGNNLVMKFASRLLARPATQNYKKRVIDACREVRPDLLITVKGVDLDAAFLQEVALTGAKTVMYYPDFHFGHRGVSLDSFVEYDLFITSKTFQVNQLNELIGPDKVYYVPHGYVDSLHRPIYERVVLDNYQDEVLHVGNHSLYKQKWLEALLTQMPELSLKVIGGRWDDNWKYGASRNVKMPGRKIGIAYSDAIQSASINVAVHHGPNEAGYQDLVSTRTFEIPACGGFMLHIDNDEVREFFRPGEEIDVFSTPDELAEKIRYYLRHPEVRARMILRAYDRCVPSYGYSQRAREVADALAARGLL